ASVRFREVSSRLSAVVAVRQHKADRVFGDLSGGVMRQLGGKESLNDTWIFSSCAAAVGAAYEVSNLGKEVVATVFTGEVDSSGPSRGVLCERAQAACQAITRSGVNVCAATSRI